jgi:hypothetical protein
VPFAGYENFDDCVSRNRDKGDPDAYCGSIKHKVEDKAMNEVIDQGAMKSRLSRAITRLTAGALSLATLVKAGPSRRQLSPRGAKRVQGDPTGRGSAKGSPPANPATPPTHAPKRGEGRGNLLPAGSQNPGRPQGGGGSTERTYLKPGEQPPPGVNVQQRRKQGQQSGSRTYLAPGEKPPQGVAVRQGSRGGRYYEGGPGGKPAPAQKPKGPSLRNPQQPFGETPGGVSGGPDRGVYREPPGTTHPQATTPGNVPPGMSSGGTEGRSHSDPSERFLYPHAPHDSGQPQAGDRNYGNAKQMAQRIVHSNQMPDLKGMSDKDLEALDHELYTGVGVSRPAIHRLVHDARKLIEREQRQRDSHGGMGKMVKAARDAADDLFADVLLNDRTYLAPGEQAPQGQREQQGARGGRYYEGEGGGVSKPGSERRKDEDWARGARPGQFVPGVDDKKPAKPAGRQGSPGMQADEDWAHGVRPEGGYKPKPASEGGPGRGAAERTPDWGPDNEKPRQIPKNMGAMTPDDKKAMGRARAIAQDEGVESYDLDTEADIVADQAKERGWTELTDPKYVRQLLLIDAQRQNRRSAKRSRSRPQVYYD